MNSQMLHGHSYAARGTSKSVLLRMAGQDQAGLAPGVLHYLLDWWRSQKARTLRFISNALRQPLEDPRSLHKRGARLRGLAPCLIQHSQCHLDLPLFGWQPEVCGKMSNLAQIADGLLSFPLPRGQHGQRAQVGNAVARVRFQAFPQTLYNRARPALIPSTQ